MRTPALRLLAKVYLSIPLPFLFVIEQKASTKGDVCFLRLCLDGSKKGGSKNKSTGCCHPMLSDPTYFPSPSPNADYCRAATVGQFA